MIDFENPKRFVYVSQAEGVKTSAEHDVLLATLLDRKREPIFSITAASSQKRSTARRQAPLLRLWIR